MPEASSVKLTSAARKAPPGREGSIVVALRFSPVIVGAEMSDWGLFISKEVC